MYSFQIYNKIIVRIIFLGLIIGTTPVNAGLLDYINPMSWIFGSSTANPEFVKAMQEGLTKGFSEGVKGATDNLFSSLNQNLGENGQGSQALNALCNNIAKQFEENGGGNEAITNFFAALGKQFKENGKGTEGLNDFFKSIEGLWNNGGEGRKALDSFFTMLGDQVRNGGQGEQTVNDAVRMFGNLFQEGGEADRALRGGVNNFANMFNEGGEFQNLTNHIAQNIGRTFEEGGEADKAKDKIGEFTRKIKEHLDREAKKLKEDWLWDLKKDMVKIAAVSGISLGLTISGYYGAKLFWQWVDRTIRRPKLIIESSYKNPISRLTSFVLRRSKTPVEMIFDSELESRLKTIAKATRNINQRIKEGKKNVKYRNLLLHGKPGTGKTMFAKKLTLESGMEYVTMSGSSFSKFKKGEGIIAMDELFAWAKKSKGLLIFIDEFESFASARENMKPNSEEYQILNNFLNYTGERSDKFMLVFATNHIKNLDSAMWRRIDDLVEVPLPKAPERERVLTMYKDRILMDERQNGSPFVSSVIRVLTDSKIKEMAVKTDGLSNGDLEGIINTIKTDADVTDDGLITSQIVDLVVDRAVQKQKTFATVSTN